MVHSCLGPAAEDAANPPQPSSTRPRSRCWPGATGGRSQHRAPSSRLQALDGAASLAQHFVLEVRVQRTGCLLHPPHGQPEGRSNARPPASPSPAAFASSLASTVRRGGPGRPRRVPVGPCASRSHPARDPRCCQHHLLNAGFGEGAPFFCVSLSLVLPATHFCDGAFSEKPELAFSPSTLETVPASLVVPVPR